jgi:galactokinase
VHDSSSEESCVLLIITSGVRTGGGGGGGCYIASKFSNPLDQFIDRDHCKRKYCT